MRVDLTTIASGKIRYLDRPSSDPRTLAFSPLDDSLYGAGWFRLFRWNLDTGRIETLDTDHKGIINNIQFTPGGQLASISRQTDSSVYFLDPASGETLRSFQRHELCGGDIAISPGGRYLATTSDDASVRIWVLQPGEKRLWLYDS